MAQPGPPRTGVVLLHGIGGAACAWRGQVARLTDAGYWPAALDFPGYGTRSPVTSLDFEDLAADVEAAIAARGFDRPVIVGHSLGGMVAQTLLRRRAKGYRAALLACTSPAFGSSDGELQRRFLAARLAPLDAGVSMAELAAGLIDTMMGPSPDPAGRAQAIALMSAVAPDTYRAALACLVRFDERANLARIGVPVLCLAGAQDPNVPPAVMERMAAQIPQARFISLTGLGHLPNLESPAAFDAALVDFLDALPALR